MLTWKRWIIVYHVPNEFKIEVDSVEFESSERWNCIADTEKATNTAKITVTNEEYFKKFNENKQIVASFTVVWADHVEKNKEYEINIPGVQEFTIWLVSFRRWPN